MLKHVTDHRKTQKMCDKPIEIEPFLLGYVPDRYKTQEMFEKAIEKTHRTQGMYLMVLSFWRCVKK